MSRRVFFGLWALAFGYTAYVVGTITGCVAVFGEDWGGFVGLTCALGPLMVGMYLSLVED